MLQRQSDDANGECVPIGYSLVMIVIVRASTVLIGKAKADGNGACPYGTHVYPHGQ